MDKKNINVFTSIKTNYLSWLVILLCVSIVSYPCISAGFITFFGLFVFSYFIHRFSHEYRNIFTILHHYHHENDNFFSHFSQIILELSLCIMVVPLYYLGNHYIGHNYIDLWTVFLFILFYSTVHNYNYGQLRVNDVHYLHHKEIHTNIGPDLCDIIFNTKNKKNTEVENTNHYIPNILILTVLVLIIKHLAQNNNVRDILIILFIILTIVFGAIISISSVYLYFTYEKVDKTYKFMNENRKKQI
jgi:hypothetical protein